MVKQKFESLALSRPVFVPVPTVLHLCTGAVLYVPHSFLLISNKFCVYVYYTLYNLTALWTILPHCVQSYRTGALKGGGMGPETSHVHKTTYGPLIDITYGAV